MKNKKPIILSIFAVLVIGVLVAMFVTSNPDKKLFAQSDASEVYTKAVDGNPEAQMMIARYYFVGSIVEKSEEKGAMWTEKAAKAGFEPAISLMGVLYMGGIGVDQSLEKAQQWLSESDDGQAQELSSFLEALNTNVAKLPDEERKQKIKENNEAAAKDVRQSFAGIVEQLKQLSDADTQALSDDSAETEDVDSDVEETAEEVEEEEAAE